MNQTTNKIGVCSSCYGKLSRTSPPYSFPAVKTAEYIISPFYYTQYLRQSILTFKFRSSPAYGELYAKLMYEEIKSLQHLKDFDMLIPVPLSRERMNERGYNQSAKIAKPLAKYFNIPYYEDILVRVKNTLRQSGLVGQMRVNNIRDAFSSKDVTNKRILILDDIHTSGSTIEECAKTLKAAGAKEVVGITLAILLKHELGY